MCMCVPHIVHVYCAVMQVIVQHSLAVYVYPTHTPCIPYTYPMYTAMYGLYTVHPVYETPYMASRTCNYVHASVQTTYFWHGHQHISTAFPSLSRCVVRDNYL
jgi:hypothetical protein